MITIFFIYNNTTSSPETDDKIFLNIITSIKAIQKIFFCLK
jgi:hypothetical protein